MCFGIIILIVGALFTLLAVLHWFEHTIDAVDNRLWNKLTMLVIMPPSVWFYPSRVASTRPSPVPHHDPVRGFGKVPLAPADANSDQPPPGTPKEFLGLPKIPPPKPKGSPSSAADKAEKLEKLRKKMREQGMLGDE